MSKQTSIPVPGNKHDYSRGLDETLKAQQLQDILAANPNVKVNPRGKLGERKSELDTPLFGGLAPQQPKLF